MAKGGFNFYSLEDYIKVKQKVGHYKVETVTASSNKAGNMNLLLSFGKRQYLICPHGFHKRLHHQGELLLKDISS
jgi:hypothetical protein